MTTASSDIANGTGQQVRLAIRAALMAAYSGHEGSTPPTDPEARIWLDDSNDPVFQLKIKNGAIWTTQTTFNTDNGSIYQQTAAPVTQLDSVNKQFYNQRFDDRYFNSEFFHDTLDTLIQKIYSNMTQYAGNIFEVSVTGIGASTLVGYARFCMNQAGYIAGQSSGICNVSNTHNWGNNTVQGDFLIGPDFGSTQLTFRNRTNETLDVHIRQIKRL